MTRASRQPNGSDLPAAPRRKSAYRGRRVERAQTTGEREWRVVDDMSTPVPIAARELDVIERWLVATGETEFGGSSAESARSAPTRIGTGEKPEALTSTKGDSL